MRDKRIIGAKAVTWDYNDVVLYDNEETVCVELTPRQITTLLSVVVQQMSWETRWFNAPPGFQEGFAARLAESLMSSKACGGTGSGGGLVDLPEWICIEDNCVEIHECKTESEVIVNIYEGCGCGGGSNCGCGGSGSNGGFTGGSGGSGGNVGGTVSDYGQNPVTPCDAASHMVPYLINQIDGMLQQLLTFLNSGLIFPDALARAISDTPILGTFNVPETAVQGLQEAIEGCIGDASAALTDDDFILKAQEAWIATYGNATQQQSVTRETLRQWAARLPLVWGNVVDGCIFTPKGTFLILVGFFNMQSLNQRLQLAAGTSTSALCEYLYAATGQIVPATTRYPNPAANTEIGGGYWLLAPQTFVVSQVMGNSAYGQYIDSAVTSPLAPGIVGMFCDAALDYSNAIELFSYIGAGDVDPSLANIQQRQQWLDYTQIPDQKPKTFIGASGLELLWSTNGQYENIGGWTLTNIQDATYDLGWQMIENAGGGHNVLVTGSVTLRVMIDGSIIPYPGA